MLSPKLATIFASNNGLCKILPFKCHLGDLGYSCTGVPVTFHGAGNTFHAFSIIQQDENAPTFLVN